VFRSCFYADTAMGDFRVPSNLRYLINTRAAELGLERNDFDWREEWGLQGDLVHRVVHRPTGSFLKVDFLATLTGTFFAFDFRPRSADLDAVDSWQAVVAAASKWLRAVKVQCDAPSAPAT